MQVDLGPQPARAPGFLAGDDGFEVRSAATTLKRNATGFQLPLRHRRRTQRDRRRDTTWRPGTATGRSARSVRCH
jgi:hypothetical protein